MINIESIQPEAKEVRKQQKKVKHLDRIRRIPGLTLYAFNPKTRQVREAEIKETVYHITEDRRSDHVNHDGESYYF